MDSATTEISTLSLHDALPIYRNRRSRRPLAVCHDCRVRRREPAREDRHARLRRHDRAQDRKSTRLNSSHLVNSYAVFCLKKKTNLHDELLDILFKSIEGHIRV